MRFKNIAKKKKTEEGKEERKEKTTQLEKKSSKAPKSPKNNRTIAEQPPERVVFPKFSLVKKDTPIYGITVLALACLVFLALLIDRQVGELSYAKIQRVQFTNSMHQWEVFAEAQPNYRDVYLYLAAGEYQLENFEKSSMYVQKALLIDPNFLPTKKLEALLLGSKTGK